jgi:hypothetical protein
MKLIACSLLLLLWIPGTAQTSFTSVNKTTGKKSSEFVFEIRPREIEPGQVAVLRWSIKGAERVAIQEAPASGIRGLREIGKFEGHHGTLEVRPTESMTYVIVCEGSSTYVCASASVRVQVKRH